MENNIFKTLSQINVNDMVDKKQTGGSTLTYLSWASAFQVAKENFSDLTYEVERNPETGMPYWYDPLTGYMVFTKVTIGGQTNEMWLPVMDGTNHAMKAEPYEVQTKYKKYKVPAATIHLSRRGSSRMRKPGTEYSTSTTSTTSTICEQIY